MTGEYSGAWRDLKEAANEVQARLLRVVQIVNHVSGGNFSDLAELKKIGRRSEHDTLLPALIKMTEAIQNLVADADLLTRAAVEGKLCTRAEAAAHHGEFRKVIEGVNNTLDAVVRPICEATECLKEMAEGNLDVAVTGDYQGEHAIIKDALNTTLVSMDEILRQVFMAIDQVAIGTQQVSGSSQDLSQGAAESASAMSEIASSMQEMNSQTKKNAENAMQASSLAVQAKANAVRGNEQVAQMVRAMENINESAASISKIIKAIDEIAFQTNLLALNAAVEAARAGKHGKGFTVVAGEVRNLAQRSARAAKETAELIEGSIKKAEAGTKIAEETSRALAEIVVGAAKVTDLIGEIASACKEQSLGIEQINQGLSQVDQVIQQNSASSEELAAASEEMLTQVEMVTQMLGRFKLKKHAVLLPAESSVGKTGGAAPKRVGQLHLARKKPGAPAQKAARLTSAEDRAVLSARLSPQEIISLENVDYGKF